MSKRPYNLESFPDEVLNFAHFVTLTALTELALLYEPVRLGATLHNDIDARDWPPSAIYYFAERHYKVFNHGQILQANQVGASNRSTKKLLNGSRSAGQTSEPHFGPFRDIYISSVTKYARFTVIISDRLVFQPRAIKTSV